METPLSASLTQLTALEGRIVAFPESRRGRSKPRVFWFGVCKHFRFSQFGRSLRMGPAGGPSASSARRANRANFGTTPGGYDADIYEPESGPGRFEGYSREVVDPGSERMEPSVDFPPLAPLRPPPITAPQAYLDEAAAAAPDFDPFQAHKTPTVVDKQSAYQARQFDRLLSPPREQSIPQEQPKPVADGQPPPPKRRRRRWDLGPEGEADAPPDPNALAPVVPVVEAPPAVPKRALSETCGAVANKPVSRGRSRSRWDVPAASAITGVELSQATPIEGSVVGAATSLVSSRWDAVPSARTGISEGKRSRWDETPVMKAASGVGSVAVTPAMVASGLVAPELLQATRVRADVEERNRYMTDAELNVLLPSEGYTILVPPASYVPLRTNAEKLNSAPEPSETPMYSLPAEGGISMADAGVPAELPDALRGLEMKPEDYDNFAKVLEKNVDENELSAEEQRQRRIMRLLLKIKNGSPSTRKVALRQITDKAREFGAGPLFNQILPLLMSPTLEDQERHLYVKVIDRILYKLDNLVRPFVHKILVVIQPLLIDEDYYAREEGREIIRNLSKAAGLPTMIATMRPDIDNPDDYVRTTTARAFSVVASALGIPALLPFLKAACRTKKSWYARHTGTKVVQEVAILMGFGVLPHLKSLVEIVGLGLSDDQARVRTVTAFALAALAEASAPFGIESFESVLKPLWQGIRLHRSKTLAAFLKAIGCVIPLMDAEYASYYAHEVNKILIREFQSPDEEMKKTVLKVVKQCVSCEGVSPEYVRTEISPEYFRCFWVRRMALDRRNYRLVVDTTLEIAIKIGGADVLGRLVEGLKDESEPYRRMVIDSIEKIASELGLSDIDSKLEERLIDGMTWAFQEHGSSGGGANDDSPVVLNALSVVIEKLGGRAQPYLKRMVSMVQWRLNNRNAKVREFAADLIAKTASVMKLCNEEELMGHLGVVLFEYLGEEFPDVLGSILGALKSIVAVIGLENMKPPVGELLPRLTPILKNRHEKVQENCILLVGRIADRGARHVSPREWMRICFELLELLKAPRKAIQKSAVSTFGFIAKAIGPSDVLNTLLNNLKVQERTQRVCTTVAIAIVAEKCMPYTVVPALMNEYRIPEMNVQNGVLKSFSFLFEYIGDSSKDYIYAVTPVLEDALVDRDLVHRQTACSAVGHLALGVRGHGVEDALVHLLNHVWPNIFETSPHVVNSVLSAIEGCMVALGPGTILLYVLSGLFHPARKVREVYWRIYNRVYVYAQDGIVPYLPEIPNIEPRRAEDATADGLLADIDEVEVVGEEDKYVRHELLLVV